MYETEGSLIASMPFAEAEVLISASLLELDTLGGRSCSREDRLSPSYRCLQAPLVALLLEGILTLSLKLTTLSKKRETDITFSFKQKVTNKISHKVNVKKNISNVSSKFITRNLSF